MFFSTDQTYLNCINNTRVICGTESRRLNFNVDTSEIKADMSFNKCGELLRKPFMQSTKAFRLDNVPFNLY